MLKLIFTTVLSILCLPAQAVANKQCMATAIFYEANMEPLEGKRAVYDVIQNRANAYKKSICQVVKAVGQFSWYPEKAMKPFDTRMQQMLLEVREAPILIDERYMWFFRRELNPRWARKMKCVIIGNHKFCRRV